MDISESSCPEMVDKLFDILMNSSALIPPGRHLTIVCLQTAILHRTILPLGVRSRV